ncbi:MAG: hypothetical protein R3B13_04290 [Polyangiaceae bacterium]
MRWLFLWGFMLLACGGEDADTPGGVGGTSAGGSAGEGAAGAGGVAGSGTGGLGNAGGSGTSGAPGSGATGSGGGSASIKYTDAAFYASHNSYSPGTDLGSLTDQLDAGVRFLELDVHDNDYAAQGFRVGHDAPGNAVALGAGNPTTAKLPDWLSTIATWSKAHPTHAPITLGLDLKDSLEDNPSYAAGNLAALNQVIEQAFGGALFKPVSSGLPTVDALRGRVLVVMSGDHATRQAYVRDEGKNPSVAINGKGQVVEIHDSGGGDLWYWTGSLTSGSVKFARHTRYDTGKNPAVLLDDSGLVVEVHENPSNSQLYYRVGKLTAALEVTWQGAGGKPFPGNDNGQNPSLGWVSKGASLREVHQSPSTSQHWYWDGTLNAAKTDITWTRKSADGGKTSDPLYDATTTSSTAGKVKVSTGSSGPFANDVLLLAVGTGAGSRIRYPQSLFVEVQPGNSELEQDGLWFFAGDARDSGDRAWVSAQRSAGKLVRLWVFNDAKYATTPVVNFGATDTPLAGWYGSYCTSVGCIKP